MTDQQFDDTLARWLSQDAAHRVPNHLGETLLRTASTRQRPWWSSPERWLPVQSTLRIAPAPRLGLIALIVLALLAVAGIAVLTAGSRRIQLAPPTGLARNGPIVYDKLGDIYRYDPATGMETALVTGAENDTAPLFSRDGSRILFSRGPDGGSPTSVLVADADGSHAHEVFGALTDWTWTDWSPNGEKLAFGSSIAGTPSITIANADGSGSTTLDAGMSATFPSWVGPDGTDILFKGDSSAGSTGLFLVKADGSSSPRPVRGAAASAAALYHDPVMSLDGTHVTYSSFEPSTWQPASGARTPGWDGKLEEVHVLDLATGGDVVIPAATDPLISSQPVDESSPYFSPDGRSVVFARDRSDGKAWLAVAPSDGSAPGHQVGVDFAPVDGERPTYAFSPDGTMVIASYPGETISLLLPVAGGPGTTVPRSASGASDMQRLAP